MRVSLFGTCLTLLASLHLAQALPSPFNEAADGTSNVVKRGAQGDHNCHGSGMCPVLERNLWRALQVNRKEPLESCDSLLYCHVRLTELCRFSQKFKDIADRPLAQMTSRTDNSYSATSVGGAMVRYKCDNGDENYTSTGKGHGIPWMGADVVQAVDNFYLNTNCGSCGSYYLDVSLTAISDHNFCEEAAT